MMLKGLGMIMDQSIQPEISMNDNTFDEWLTEDFLFDDVKRTADQQEKLEKLYDYLMLMKEYEDDLEDEE